MQNAVGVVQAGKIGTGPITGLIRIGFGDIDFTFPGSAHIMGHHAKDIIIIKIMNTPDIRFPVADNFGQRRRPDNRDIAVDPRGRDGV